MGRLHGRRGQFYVALASGGTAEPLAFQNKWTINFTTDKVDVTAFGDGNKVYVAGLPDAAGTGGGFYDDATAQLYTAAQDGVARKFYLYPSNANTAQYWYGTALFDFSVDGGVSDAISDTFSWAAAGSITKIG